MRNAIAQFSAVALWASLFAAPAQIGSRAPHPFIRTITESNRPSKMYRAAEKEIADGAFDTAAEALLKSAEKFTKRIFHVPALQFDKAVTYRTEDGDLMIARWTLNESFGKGSVILRDSPDFSLYSVRLSGFRVQTRQDIDKLITGMVVMNDRPIGIEPERTKFEVFGEAGTITSFSWGYDPKFPSQFPGLRDVYIMGGTDTRDWYVTVGVGKMFTKQDYPVLPYVRERFPPLTELVKGWSASQIRVELEKGRKTPSDSINGARETILLEELARRGLTADEVVELLKSAHRGEDYFRLTHLRNAFKRAGKPLDIAWYFTPTLQQYEQVRGQFTDMAVSILFREAAKNCSAAYEQQALRVLTAGAFRSGPLSYLGRCANSEETIQAIGAARLPEEATGSKRAAIDAIRRRMAQPKTKRPPRSPATARQ